jgi:hypothetical protein
MLDIASRNGKKEKEWDAKNGQISKSAGGALEI